MSNQNGYLKSSQQWLLLNQKETIQQKEERKDKGVREKKKIEKDEKEREDVIKVRP